MGQDREVVCTGKVEGKPEKVEMEQLPVEVYFMLSLLIFKVSSLQHWNESRTEGLTSILTTSSPFGLSS